MESPMLVGRMSEWTFNVKNVPHRVFYWRLPNGSSFDSIAVVSGIQKIAMQAFEVFGSAPYREYSFLLQDGAWSGGLEHPNSVTLGSESKELAKDPNFTMRELAHEFFHTWNLMAIEPAEYRGVDYKVQPPVSELWFSEGLTILYSDLMQRRAGLPVDDSTRVRHLAHLIERYYSMPGLARFSAEHVSRVAYNSSPDALGDYSASAHLQGEIIGNILDFRIRDATNGAKSIDDVMRSMYQRFNGKKFTSQDVQSAVEQACGCNTRDIFDRYVFNAGAIDFNRYLEPMGLKPTLTWAPARDADGKPQPDLRAWAYERAGSLKLRVSDPESIWGKAGLHTGDDVVSINGVQAKTWPEFRAIFGKIAVGDSSTLVIRRGGATISKTVIATGYDRPNVSIESIVGASEKQRRLFNQWATGKPDRSSSM
jgi:predicted metalloprotease with PDZ domain